MPVIQRGQSWQATVNHRGERFRRQFPTELEAQAWEIETKIALSKGQQPDLGDAALARSGVFRCDTLGELMEYMIDHTWRGTKGEKAATINARHIARLIGTDTPIKAISSHTVNVAILKLRDAGYPDVTLNKKLSPLRMALRYAAQPERAWIPLVPDIKFFKTGEGRLRWFTLEEEQAMLGWALSRGDYDLWDYIAVSMDTGMRQGEVLDLTARNLSPGKVTLWGARTEQSRGTKAGNTRTIPLTDRAGEVLTRRAKGNHGKLFAQNKDQITRMWNAMRDALGFADDPEFVPHAMRHTFCSRLVMANVNLKVVQTLAGHLRIETTLKYVHLSDNALVEAIALLAPRENNVYTAAPQTAGNVPHATVACHTADVADAAVLGKGAKVLNIKGKAA